MATKQFDSQSLDNAITTARIESFSDGVFAIAITLLVLQLDLPPGLGLDATNQQLIDALQQTGHSYFTFLLSFLVIGRYWIAHHNLFHRIKRSDSGLAALNLLLLLTVVALPFPTEVLGDYGELPSAAVFYALSISLVGIMMAILWRHAVRRQLLQPDVSEKIIRQTYHRSLAVPAVFIASIPLAIYVNVYVAEIFWMVTFVASSFLRR